MGGSGPLQGESAREAEASYIELVWLVYYEEHLRRLRDKQPASEIDAHNQTRFEDPDSDLVDGIRRHSRFPGRSRHLVRLRTGCHRGGVVRRPVTRAGRQRAT